MCWLFFFLFTLWIFGYYGAALHRWLIHCFCFFFIRVFASSWSCLLKYKLALMDKWTVNRFARTQNVGCACVSVWLEWRSNESASFLLIMAKQRNKKKPFFFFDFFSCILFLIRNSFFSVFTPMLSRYVYFASMAIATHTLRCFFLCSLSIRCIFFGFNEDIKVRIY